MLQRLAILLSDRVILKDLHGLQSLYNIRSHFIVAPYEVLRPSGIVALPVKELRAESESCAPLLQFLRGYHKVAQIQRTSRIARFGRK